MLGHTGGHRCKLGSELELGLGTAQGPRLQCAAKAEAAADIEAELTGKGN